MPVLCEGVEDHDIDAANAFLDRSRPLEGREDVYALAPAFEAESDFIKTSGERERRGAQIQNRSFKRRSGL